MTAKNAMKIYGIGPQLIISMVPYSVLVFIIRSIDPGFLQMDFLSEPVAKALGFTWLAIGVIFFVCSVKTIYKGFKKGELITSGTYRLCRNPIYGSFIIFFIPALGLLLKSWIILSVTVVLYLNFKLLIHEEYHILKEIFGEEYERYAREVNEIFPIPKFRA